MRQHDHTIDGETIWKFAHAVMGSHDAVVAVWWYCLQTLFLAACCIGHAAAGL